MLSFVILSIQSFKQGCGSLDTPMVAGKTCIKKNKNFKIKMCSHDHRDRRVGIT